MSSIGTRRLERAFALPTVVITAVILMTLLVGGLSSVTSVRRGLSTQYYRTLAREAAEAGAAFAKICASQQQTNASGTGWSLDGATVLNTGDICTGAVPSGTDCATVPFNATNQQRCWVMYSDDGKIRTNFIVAPITAVGTSYTIKVTGYTRLYVDASTNTAYQDISYTQYQTIAIDPRVGIETGNDTSCAVQYGLLYCWGRNNYGQVGVGYRTTESGGEGGILTPALIGGALTGKYVHDVATGIGHTCAITGADPLPGKVHTLSGGAYSKIYCWGSNGVGQFGSTSFPTVNNAPSESIVLNMTDHYATEITARDRSCVIAPQVSDTSLRHMYCWGDNNQKQAGRSANCGTASNGDTPDPKNAFGCQVRWNNSDNAVLTTVSQINAVTNGNSCGVLSNEQRAFCFGNGSQYGNGNGDNEDIPRAVRVRVDSSTYLSGVSKVATNNGRACALATHGAPSGIRKIYCWGANWDSTAGRIDFRVDARFTGNRVQYASRLYNERTDSTYNFYQRDVSDFAISDWNTCFISTSTSGVMGTVYCSGYNHLGQLGNGTVDTSVTPTNSTTSNLPRKAEWASPVGGALAGKVVESLVGGNDHFCAITSEDEVYCWGANQFGQLGDGTTTNRSSPVKAQVPKDIVF